MIFSEENLLERLRRERPLVHCITNYVTAGDVANYLLAAGASPVMAEEPKEVEKVVSAAQALVLNLGTLHEGKVSAMELAGRRAASLGKPIVLDPVGAGGASFRTEAAKRLIEGLPCTVIRGNASEILALAQGTHSVRGVDAGEQDEISGANLEACVKAAANLARVSKAVIVMTGKTDLVTDGRRTCRIRNGHPMMKRITGTGCMLDALTAAFLGLSSREGRPGDPFERAVYAAAVHGLCGELAWARTEEENGGAGAFRMRLFDAVSMVTDRQVLEGARLEDGFRDTES